MQSPALQPHFAGGDAGEQRAVEANERLSCRIVEVDGVRLVLKFFSGRKVMMLRLILASLILANARASAAPSCEAKKSRMRGGVLWLLVSVGAS
ncbi:MAG: hypothetical protein WA851_02510, partial [Xanthobacteraceae bacterium]